MVGDNRLNMKQDNISTEMAMSNIEKKNQFQDRRFFVTYSWIYSGYTYLKF